ncbi:MAG: hypothetical protein ACJ71T_16935 [Actinomycetales bacterium]
MLAAVLTGLGAALALLATLLPGVRLNRLIPAGLLVLLLAGAATATAFGSALTGRAHALVVILALVAAALGGSQVTGAVFELVDTGHGDDVIDIVGGGDGDESAGQPQGLPPAEGSLRSAGRILRGGMWIGVLERLAVFATLVARWPEGIAVVLAVKGLGRYPELRTWHRPGLAERFIIGTLVSGLWAGLCAYAAAGPALG